MNNLVICNACENFDGKENGEECSVCMGEGIIDTSDCGCCGIRWLSDDNFVMERTACRCLDCVSCQ